MEIRDDLGREFELRAPPRRIVSLVPSLTELLFAIGAGDALVAVTRFCTEPAAQVAVLPKIGGTKTPDLPAILTLAPDLVVMNAEENRRGDFAALAAAGVPIFVSEPKTVMDAVRLIARLGTAVGRLDEARTLAAAQQARVAALTAAIGARPRVPYFAPIWKKPWMAFNADTYAHDLLGCAGGENVVGACRERYPRVTLEEIAATAPDVVLLPDEPYPFRTRDLPAFAPLAETPAFARGRVHFVDGKALTWYGPRIAAAVETFARLLHETA
jgi:ABC-type Fe3+-hydroxamate transport system substrate-binding protein